MVVEVRLYATLRRYTPASPNGVITVDVPDGSTVLDLVRKVNLYPTEIHLIIVNGIGCDFEKRLNNGDRVGLFPPVGGG
ncbi:MoaD/ThiS family protein [Sporomusa acidovorans]|uniref:ThiS family protein n=1 Tax=Sporomusa acidovorans (strain ATCC 49682 / DSM 3132 / Mol) TaxID=1123286 RepID=A0ABZ3IXE7_SPOA4|nr:MoaD/ThiS family protein [Sporomusa acidovorans]OZC23348.1 ThiS family protein [Sporomusa acidovorans DSM 3132]SDE42611.1 Molybdopterin converting factor, small subunit [Sporomusa acidovorans]